MRSLTPFRIKECAADLASKKGRALVVAGSRQPVEVHVIVGLINQALGAIQGASGPLQLVKHGRKELPGIQALTEAIQSGAVETLFVTTHRIRLTTLRAIVIGARLRPS